MAYSPEGLKTPTTEAKTAKKKRIKKVNTGNSLPGKSLGASFELQFTRDLILGESKTKDIRGKWAFKIEDNATVGQLFKWNELFGFWDYVPTAQGERLAAAWLEEHCPDKATPDRAKTCWKFALMSVGRSNQLPLVDETLNLIPTKSGYMKVYADGQIELVKPDPALGLDWLMDVSIPSTPSFGVKFTLPAVPSESHFGKYLDSSLPDLQIRAIVQEMCAQTFMTQNFQKCGWFIGEPGSGKSVLLELMGDFHRKACALDLENLGDTHSLAGLLDASLIVIDEVPLKSFNEEKFKPLISQNKMSVRAVYENAITFTPKAKILIGSNQPAIIKDKSEGVWRRIVFIPWSAKPKAIHDLHKIILESERAILLSWIVEGIARITKRGGLTPMNEMPYLIKAENEFIRENSDSVLGWIQSAGVRVDSQSSIVTYQVYNSYSMWAERNGVEHPLSQSNFAKALKIHLPEAFPSVQKTWINEDNIKSKDRFYPIQIGHETELDKIFDIPYPSMNEIAAIH